MDYAKLADYYEQLEKTSKRLRKTYILSQVLKMAKEDLKEIVYLLQGRVFAAWEKRELGVSSKLIAQAISNSTGASKKTIQGLANKEGDYGIVAEKLLSKGRQSTLSRKKLTSKKVAENIRKLPDITGKGAVENKLKVVSELLNMAEPKEARYIVRTVLEKLRTGVGSGTVRDALVWAFLPKIIGIYHYCQKCGQFTMEEKCYNCKENVETNFKEETRQKFGKLKKYHADSIKELENLAKHVDIIIPESEKNARKLYNHFVDEMQKAYDMSTDYGMIAEKVREDGLESLGEVKLQAGKAIKVMLYVKAKDFEDAFSIVGKPAIAERKFDGFRLQIHGKDGKVQLFTRRLDDVTSQFPDIMERVKKNIRAKNFILDAEIVGINPKTKKFEPFQKISQRIKRKYDIQKLVKELPVVVKIFDAMEINGENLIKEPLEKRSKKLKKIIKQEKHRIEFVEQKKVSKKEELERFYNQALEDGVEGVMLKKIDGIYKPGSRVGYGVKLKPEMENLDLVVVAAEWGEGKRANWLSSFTLACRDGKEFKPIGKVGTGIKEKGEGITFKELTRQLRPLIEEKKGKTVKVKPKIIMEIAYQEIQKSPSYASGFALRFPRLVRMRTDDKSLSEINSKKDIKRLYRQQSGK